MSTAAAGIEQLLRTLAPEVLGAVVRRFGNFADAEDGVQEALLAAALRWPEIGLPENPRGWLIQVASRRLIDTLRSEGARRRRESEAGAAAETVMAPNGLAPEEDDTLALLFMCCHPALTRASAIALTLRAVGGLTTAEIANAFLVPEATMAQRIGRAKQSIAASAIPFQLPNQKEWSERLRTVLHVLYLIFNEGYANSVGAELQRAELATEALRLARLLREKLPDDTEVAGLLALMLLTDARRLARSGAHGELIPLPEQNRSLWNKTQIAEGVALLSEILPKGVIGPYQLQAAIAAVHDEAERSEDTDWLQILALYTILRRITSNPVVTLNYAVAHAMVHGAEAGLSLLRQLDEDPHLSEHYRLHAVRAHLLERAGDRTAAAHHYRRAAGRTTSLPERDYLLTQAARCAEVEQKS
jgi:RNA polymerase sigma factor (sigma-70 family)